MSKLLKATQNIGYTANGAVTRKSTLNPLLDFFALGAASRGRDISNMFAEAVDYDRVNAYKALFYTRDIRGGQGERSTFRNLLKWTYDNDRSAFNALVPLVPEYGRWDDILPFVDSPIVVSLVDSTLDEDFRAVRKNGKNVTLLAKWMPSENASSKNTRALARKWIKALHMNAAEYRRVLSRIRKHLNIVERLMSAREWDAIKYAGVPSKAMTNYRKAFSKHDPDGFVAYLNSVKKGETKINAGTLYPYELFEKLNVGFRGGNRLYVTHDDVINEQWKALPDYVQDDNSSAIVVADTSGSMNGRPLAVSVSLAIYFAERAKGPFKNEFITFSNKPTFHHIRGNTFSEKVESIDTSGWDMNTNFQAVFDLILNTAVSNRLKDEDLPQKIFVVSDMQFDSAGRLPNFDTIRRKYAGYGYTMPVLVFWNVNAFNKEVPVTENELGVYLVSGCSPSIFKNALNTKATTPVELMMDVLNGERYERVGEALR